MDSGYLPRKEHEEFSKRIEEENERTNYRLKKLEEFAENQNRLLMSVEKLANSVENMQKQLNTQGERLEVIESRDGEKWRDYTKSIGLLIVGAVLALVFAKIGL